MITNKTQTIGAVAVSTDYVYDSLGQLVVETYTYDAYGNPTIYDASGSEISQSAIGNRYLFQGREYDSATHLYYFRARYYNPETATWLSKDPKGIAGGLNLYLAFGNNPVNFTDPMGLDNIHATGNLFFGAFEVFTGTVSEGVGFFVGMYGRLTNDQDITDIGDNFADKATLVKREGMDRFSDAVREYGNPDGFIIEQMNKKKPE